MNIISQLQNAIKVETDSRLVKWLKNWLECETECQDLQQQIKQLEKRGNL